MATKKTPLSKSVAKRLKLIPGSARQRLDPKTGIIYSRRQFEKVHVRLPRKNALSIKRKYNQYLQLVDAYREKELQKGKVIGRRKAMNSDKMKKIVKKIHSKKPTDRKWALEQTVYGDKVKDWKPYLKKWAKGDL